MESSNPTIEKERNKFFYIFIALIIISSMLINACTEILSDELEEREEETASYMSE